MNRSSSARVRPLRGWTARDARLANVPDDDLAVYAHDRNAVLVTHDREFSRQRGDWTIGQHIQLRCNEWEAADLLARTLPDLIVILERKRDVFIVVSTSGYEVVL